MPFASASRDDLAFAAFVCIALGVYFLPTVIAIARAHRNTLPIVVVNLLTGWTLIGYVVALAWSMIARPEAGTRSARR